MVHVRLRVDPDDRVQGQRYFACCLAANCPAPVGAAVAVGAGAAGCCHGNSDPVFCVGAGQEPVRPEPLRSPADRLVPRAAGGDERALRLPEALIAALFAAYSASHWLAVFIAPVAGAWPYVGDCVTGGVGTVCIEGAGTAGAGATAPVFSWARHWERNCGQVSPFVVPAALAACHWSPHCFMTLWALAGVTPRATPRAINAAAPKPANDFSI